MTDLHQHKNQVKNAIEMISQIKQYDLDLDRGVLEDIVHDADRLGTHAAALLEACQAANVEDVASLLARDPG